MRERERERESERERERELFYNGNKTKETIPPTRDGLQHSKRLAYQAGIWSTSLLVK